MNVVDVLGIQVPRLLHTSDVQTSDENEQWIDGNYVDGLPSPLTELMKSSEISKMLIDVNNKDVKLLFDAIVERMICSKQKNIE